VHLVVETPEPNLGRGMQRLHGDYATWFNERHGTVGHVFQGRYGAKRILDDVHLITAVRYLDSNPVEAGLAAKPEDWPWCGRGATPPAPWLARERWRDVLKEGV
jgi:putative transposase